MVSTETSVLCKTVLASFKRYAQEPGFFVHKVYPDDGYSGTSFDRPGFQEMIDDIETGRLMLSSQRIIVR